MEIGEVGGPRPVISVEDAYQGLINTRGVKCGQGHRFFEIRV